jgi:LysM repeat protein
MADDFELTYTVTEGDTLDSIAREFSLSVPWLIEANNLDDQPISPGDALRVFGSTIFPIDVGIYQSPGQPDITGALVLEGGVLVFEPTNKSQPLRTINLLGHLENAQMPHPTRMADDLSRADAPCMLVLTHLKDPQDEQSMETVFFTGKKSDLTRYQEEINRVASFAQKLNNYVAPNPNEIRIVRPRPAVKLPQIEVVGASQIVEVAQISQIRTFMPLRFRKLNWTLMFQLSVDGCSWGTLFDRTRQSEPLVLVILTDSGDKLGAYLPLGLRKSTRSYGTGETFVFKLTPSFEAFRWNRSGNEVFTISSENDLMIGGGGGSAIFIGADMLSGCTAPCATFASPPLVDRGEFRVVNVEAWQVGKKLVNRRQLLG